MALDTRDKRASAIHVTMPWRGLLPLPDGALNQGDRQHTAFMYRGIAPPGGAVVADTTDKGRDAGSGRKPAWWEGYWVDPGRLPEADLIPLRPTLVEARHRLRELKHVVVREDTRTLAADIGRLVAGVDRLEAKAKRVAREQEIAPVVRDYRALAGRVAAVQAAIARLEEKAVLRARILRDDEEFITLMMEIL